MLKKSRENLSTLIQRKLALFKCHQHNLSIDRANIEKLCLQCQKCSGPSIDIEDIVKNPIKVAMGYGNKNNGLDIVGKMGNIYEHDTVKMSLEKIIEDIKIRVNSLCNGILESFSEQWEKAFCEAPGYILEVEEARIKYKSVFEELLETNFTEGTVSEFENILKQFCAEYSEDPSDFVNQRVEGVFACMEDMPIVDWDALEKLYEVVSDPDIWKVENIVKQSRKSEIEMGGLEKEVNKNSLCMLIPEVTNTLKNDSYSLIFNQEQVTLYSNCIDELNPLESLTEAYDTFYESSKHSLLGLNYEGITLFSYLLGNLEKKKHYPIKACSNLLIFETCMIVESENRILRIWFDGYKEVISLSGFELNYGNEGEFYFKNRKGEIVRNPAYHLAS